LPEFLGELGADEALPLSDLCCMAEGDLIGALDNTFQDGEALTPRQRAGIIKLVRAAFAQEGFDPPAMGGACPKRHQQHHQRSSHSFSQLSASLSQNTPSQWRT